MRFHETLSLAATLTVNADRVQALRRPSCKGAGNSAVQFPQVGVWFPYCKLLLEGEFFKLF